MEPKTTKKPSRKLVVFKRELPFYLMLIPGVTFLIIFSYLPMFGLVMAFQDFTPLRSFKNSPWVGLKNFHDMLALPTFWNVVGNTLSISIAKIILRLLVPLILALLLNEVVHHKFMRMAQTVFFLPYVTNSIAIGMVFAAMFNIVGSFYGTENEIVVTAGIINNIIEFFGGTRVNWINYGSSYTANMVVMIVYIVWNALPFKILILLGGLQAINRQYYEAARVDSTPRWRVFTRITMPLVSPMLAYVVITGFIGGFKEYTSIVGIFGETMGPPNDGGRLNTMVGFIYDSLSNNSQGRASAAALILFGIILVVTLINLWVSKKRVHY